MLRINLVIEELKATVEPLKEQNEIAKKYVSFKDELKEIEIGLITSDITNINNSYQVLKDDVKKIQDELLDKESINNANSASIEKLKSELTKLEEIISEKNSKLISLNNELAKLNADRIMMIERKKYDYDKDQISNVIISLKEDILALNKDATIFKKDIEEFKKKYTEESKTKDDLDDKVLNNKVIRSGLLAKLANINKNILSVENKIEILENNILSNAKVPASVQSVLNNPRFSDVYGTISSLVETSDEYLNALDTALGASANFLVTANEKVIKNAINYLKENNLGKATFFPINIIKPRYVDHDMVNRLKDLSIRLII